MMDTRDRPGSGRPTFDKNKTFADDGKGMLHDYISAED